MRIGMLRPYCKTRWPSEENGAGTTTPGHRASKWSEAHPSRRSSRKASLFDGRSLSSMESAPPVLGITVPCCTPPPSALPGQLGLAPVYPSRVNFRAASRAAAPRTAKRRRTPDEASANLYNGATLAADMNRPSLFAPPAPPAQPPPRALSGWRARLASDPIPRLLREGSPSVLARVRRDLIDDSEAPAAEEISSYPEVKALLRKIEKDGSVAPRTTEKELGSPKFAKCLAALRTLDRLADYGLRVEEKSALADKLKKVADFILGSQQSDGGIADLTVGEGPKGKAKIAAVHFQGWALSALCRGGFESDPRIEKGFGFLLSLRQDDGGWAWRGVRTDSAARPSSHLITGMVLRAFASSKEH